MSNASTRCFPLAFDFKYRCLADDAALSATTQAQIVWQKLFFFSRGQRRTGKETHRRPPPHINQPFSLTQCLYSHLLFLFLLLHILLLLLFTSLLSFYHMELGLNTNFSKTPLPLCSHWTCRLHKFPYFLLKILC